MAKKILLRNKPYTVGKNSSKFESLRIVLNPMCGFEQGDLVYQVKRPNGIIELVPEKVFNEDDYK